MYYEIHGPGDARTPPLVLLHGGGSTIGTTFGRILPELAKTRQVIAVELQAHGHTRDIDRPLSFEQDADDVAALLAQLQLEKADAMGFSNGGTTALQVAIRHPKLVNKLVLASTTYQRDGMRPGFFEGFQNATLEQMPQPLKDAYLEANPDRKGLQAMFDRASRGWWPLRILATRTSGPSRRRRWSSTGTPKWCGRSMRWHYHARCHMPNWPSCRADMGITLERSAQISRVNCRL